jgi:RND family efflux transporter MFP subunit
MPNLRHLPKALLPPLVLLLAVGAAALMIALKPEPEKKPPVPVYPKVTVHSVRPLPAQPAIESQGTVRARQQTRLTARVSGHIEWVAPELYEGGHFEAGAPLLRIDPLPYESALAEARARLALAEATLLQEQEAAAQARIDWEHMGRAGEPGPLVLREPQLMRARADREAASAAVAHATRNLADCVVRAPYAGRVDAKFVDVGQAITAQATILAEVHATGSLEVPIPLTLDEHALLAPQSQATVSADIAGATHAWEARLDRAAASVDPQTRMLTVFVRVDTPMANGGGAPLRPGMFVSVALPAQLPDNTLSLPRAALQPGDIVYRLTSDDRLESVQLDVIHTDARQALVADGLQAGDRLCLTPLLFFVEGMRVEVANTATPAEPLP